MVGFQGLNQIGGVDFAIEVHDGCLGGVIDINFADAFDRLQCGPHLRGASVASRHSGDIQGDGRDRADRKVLDAVLIGGVRASRQGKGHQHRAEGKDLLHGSVVVGGRE